MQLDYEVSEAIGSLINELRSALGESALKLPSVRKAMLLLAHSAWRDAETVREEVEAAIKQDGNKKPN